MYGQIPEETAHVLQNLVSANGLNVISIYHGSSGSNNYYSVATSEASYQLGVNTMDSALD